MTIKIKTDPVFRRRYNMGPVNEPAPGVKYNPEPEVAERYFKTIQSMTRVGAPASAICAALGLKWETISEYYKDAIDTGYAEAEAALAKRIWNLAMEAESEQVSFNAAKFYLATRHKGWSEKTALEISGPNGDPIRTIHAKMTPEEAAEMYAKVRNGETDDQPST